MKKIVLKIEDFTSTSELHTYLQDALGLPDYYGDNLDALYDCLTELEDEMEIVVPQAVAEDDALGEYGERLLQVFEEAGAENDALKVVIV